MGKDLGEATGVEKTGEKKTGGGGGSTGHVEISWQKATLEHVRYITTRLSGYFSKYVKMSTKKYNLC